MTQTVLTALGFKRKRYDDFITEMEQTARELFGNNVNLDTNSPLGKFIKLNAFARADENELAEAVYLSAYVDHAEGVSLDRVGKYIGVTRTPAAAATGVLTFTCTAGKTIPAGTIIATTSGLQYATDADATDTGDTGSVTTSATASTTGVSYNVPANTLTVIKTPISGVTAVTNAAAFTGGRSAETDNEFRQKYKNSVAKGGASTTDAITATLLDTTGVRAAVVIENDTDAADGAGRPAHSFESVVLGGTITDVATAILESKAGGIRAYGSTTATVNDKSGNPKTIGFSYATQVNIWVKITLTKNAEFPVDGNSQVELAAIQYIGGTDASNNVYNGLGMGDDVVFGQLVKGAFLIAGVDDAAVQVSTDGVTWTSGNITIATTEVAQTDSLKVTVL